MYTTGVFNGQTSNDGPLVIHFNPGKLTDLASVSFAAALLQLKNKSSQNGVTGFDCHASALAPVPVPNTLLNMIDELVVGMEKPWKEWCDHHSKEVFKSSPNLDMIDWLNHFAWSHDGTINYELTAKKLLRSCELTNEQKYQLACAYCFIDDVERWKRTLMQNFKSKQIYGFEKIYVGIFDYWEYRLSIFRPKNALELLSTLTNLSQINDFWTSSIPYDEWAAIEYCFDHLNEEDRWRKACSIVHLIRPRVTLKLLPKLTGSELNKVIKECSFIIMRALVRNSDYIEYTILIWKRMVHIIYDYSLVQIVRYVHNLKCEKSYKRRLFWEIWSHTLEHQKNYIIDKKICNFIKKEADPNLPLILDFLSRCDRERRFEYWCEHWPCLVIGQLDSENRGFIDRIMKLCLVDDQKIEDFKRTKMTDYESIADLCEILLYEERFKDIQSYLEFCTSDSQLIRDLKKKIIIKMRKSFLFEILMRRLNDENRDFFHYLDDAFTENESKEFLNEIATHPDTLNSIYRELLRWPDGLEDVMKTVEKFASSEENLIKMKDDLFELCRLDSKIKKSVIIDLMAWCMNADEPVVKKFKRVSCEADV